MELKETVNQLDIEREAIERMLFLFPEGLTPAQIAGRTHFSLALVRKCLQTMKESKHVRWFARWYGRNAGYARKYVLTTEGKQEVKEY